MPGTTSNSNENFSQFFYIVKKIHKEFLTTLNICRGIALFCLTSCTSWRMNKLWLPSLYIIQIIKSLFVIWNKLLLLCVLLHKKDASSSQRLLIHLSILPSFNVSKEKNKREKNWTNSAKICVNKARKNSKNSYLKGTSKATICGSEREENIKKEAKNNNKFVFSLLIHTAKYNENFFTFRVVIGYGWIYYYTIICAFASLHFVPFLQCLLASHYTRFSYISSFFSLTT